MRYYFKSMRDINWPTPTEYTLGSYNFNLILKSINDNEILTLKQEYIGDKRLYFEGWSTLTRASSEGFKTRESRGDPYTNYVYLSIHEWAENSREILNIKIGKTSHQNFLTRAFENGSIAQLAIGEFPNGIIAKQAEKEIYRELKKLYEKSKNIKITTSVPRPNKNSTKKALKNFLNPKKDPLEALKLLYQIKEKEPIKQIIEKHEGEPITELMLYENTFIENKKTRKQINQPYYLNEKTKLGPIQITEIIHLRGPYLVFQGKSKNTLSNKPSLYIIDLRPKEKTYQETKILNTITFTIK